MTFSIRRLLAGVAVAALFAGGLAYHTIWWATGLVTLTLAIFTAATLGVWLKRLTREFWLTFAFVGWVYLTLAFVPATVSRIADRLPGTTLNYWIWTQRAPAHSNNEELSRSNEAYGRTVVYDDLVPEGFAEHLDIMQSLFALSFATLSGIVTVLLLRRTSPIA